MFQTTSYRQDWSQCHPALSPAGQAVFLFPLLSTVCWLWQAAGYSLEAGRILDGQECHARERWQVDPFHFLLGLGLWTKWQLVSAVLLRWVSLDTLHHISLQTCESSQSLCNGKGHQGSCGFLALYSDSPRLIMSLSFLTTEEMSSWFISQAIFQTAPWIWSGFGKSSWIRFRPAGGSPSWDLWGQFLTCLQRQPLAYSPWQNLQWW